MTMAGGEELGAGQIPAVGVAGGEGKREGEHEGVLGYLWVVLGRLGMAGAVLPTGGRAGGRRRAAAEGFRRAEEEKGRAGEVRWGTEELMVRSVWEGRGRRGEFHSDPRSRRR
jgi:hypothetical protein